MSILRNECPHVLHRSAQSPVTQDVWIDTPLLVVAGYAKAQATLSDPIPVVTSVLHRAVQTAHGMGARTIHMVFDGPPRKLKDETREKRAIATEARTQKVLANPLKKDLEMAQLVVDWKDHKLAPVDTETLTEFLVESPSLEQTEALSFPEFSVVNRAAKEWVKQRQEATHGAVQYHHAKHDSEEYIAFHMKQGDLAISSDSDILCFGATWVVQHFATEKETWIQLQDVLDALKMTIDQFRVLCVLLGNDFNVRMKGCGPVKSLALVRGSSVDNPAAVMESRARLQFASDEDAEQWIGRAMACLDVFQLKAYA